MRPARGHAAVAASSGHVNFECAHARIPTSCDEEQEGRERGMEWTPTIAPTRRITGPPAAPSVGRSTRPTVATAHRASACVYESRRVSATGSCRGSAVVAEAQAGRVSATARSTRWRAAVAGVAAAAAIQRSGPHETGCATAEARTRIAGTEVDVEDAEPHMAVKKLADWRSAQASGGLAPANTTTGQAHCPYA